jgi:hypothetical protein
MSSLHRAKCNRASSRHEETRFWYCLPFNDFLKMKFAYFAMSTTRRLISKLLCVFECKQQLYRNHLFIYGVFDYCYLNVQGIIRHIRMDMVDIDIFLSYL